MSNTRQHLLHEQKLMELLEIMPSYVSEYVDDKLDTRSPSTLYNYVLDYKLFFEWLIKKKIVKCSEIKDIPYSVLENLKLEQAKAFIRDLNRRDIQVNKKETKKPEKESVNRKISALRSLFKYLTTQTEKDDGEPYFYRNVMLKIEVTKVKETLSARASRISQKIFHNNDDVLFLDFIKNEYENKLGEGSRSKIYFKRDKERDYAILSLFLGSGIRVNELTNLRLRDLDFEKNRIWVIRKGDKSDVVPVTPESMLDVKEYLNVRCQRYNATDDENEFVFVTKTQNTATPLSNRTVETLVKKYTKAFKTNKSMSPHKLRHTYATNLMAQEKDIHMLMTQLGHTSTTTAALYDNPELDKAQEAAAKMGKRRK
ncbi:tyrosine recombinase XerS [Bacillus sp. FJAT-29937]|uniref:tyrosine recombinase XerS n=1 Tax=Bacillus sp. FJAT-29937 TaxID=1720553 RepID=UPI00082F30C3|nr:tyrosine recombinase XerS [Bacillus sp. FJAT-29937]